MDKTIEKRIEKKVGKKIGKQIKKDIEKEVQEKVEEEVKEVEKDIGKEIEDEVKKEVKKRLPYRLYETTKSSAFRFQKELRTQTATAVTAAFAFLIALSWRTPIQKSIDNLIGKLGLTGKAVYIEYLSAIAITIIAVLALMLVSKWIVEKEQKG